MITALKRFFKSRFQDSAPDNTPQPSPVSVPSRYRVEVHTSANASGETEYYGVVIDTFAETPDEIIHKTPPWTTDDPQKSPPDGYEDCSFADDNDGALRRNVLFDARQWLSVNHLA